MIDQSCTIYAYRDLHGFHSHFVIFNDFVLDYLSIDTYNLSNEQGHFLKVKWKSACAQLYHLYGIELFMSHISSFKKTR